MNPIQVILLVSFLVALLVTYRQQLGAVFSRTLVNATPAPKSSIAVTLVKDLLAVTELRDKLAAENYQEGVDACTVLLRVIVEHNHAVGNQTKGVV